MKKKAQMISAEPKIRMPAWRSPSPKNLKTRPGVDLPRDPDAEAGDLPEGVEPAAGDVEPADHRTACSSGLVASRIELTTNWKKKTATREITTAWLTARPTPAAPPEADIPL